MAGKIVSGMAHNVSSGMSHATVPIPVTHHWLSCQYHHFLSLVLLPRDAMHKRGLCCHAVSVCVSVTFVHCVKTNKDNFKYFHHQVATPF